jgi:hypothetical protein
LSTKLVNENKKKWFLPEKAKNEGGKGFSSERYSPYERKVLTRRPEENQGKFNAVTVRPNSPYIRWRTEENREKMTGNRGARFPIQLVRKSGREKREGKLAVVNYHTGKSKEKLP